MLHFYTCSAPTARFGLLYRNILLGSSHFRKTWYWSTGSPPFLHKPWQLWYGWFFLDFYYIANYWKSNWIKLLVGNVLRCHKFPISPLKIVVQKIIGSLPPPSITFSAANLNSSFNTFLNSRQPWNFYIHSFVAIRMEVWTFFCKCSNEML